MISFHAAALRAWVLFPGGKLRLGEVGALGQGQGKGSDPEKHCKAPTPLEHNDCNHESHGNRNHGRLLLFVSRNKVACVSDGGFAGGRSDDRRNVGLDPHSPRL